MLRRTFLAAIAALPVIGRVKKPDDAVTQWSEDLPHNFRLVAVFLPIADLDRHDVMTCCHPYVDDSLRRAGILFSEPRTYTWCRHQAGLLVTQLQGGNP